MYGLHGTECGFVHRRIIGGVTGFLAGGPAGAVSGIVSGGGGRPQQRRTNLGLTDARRRSITRAMDAATARGDSREANRFLAELGTQGRLSGGGGGCLPPLVSDLTGGCFAPGSPSADFGTGGGAAVMGRFGAAMAPMGRSILTLDCLPGMVLGKDDLCYNRRDISNKERKWPRGTKPLGTPGEMAALRKAASFGRRMETTIKRMQKIGVIKKPASRKSPPKPKMLAPGSGVHVVNVE